VISEGATPLNYDDRKVSKPSQSMLSLPGQAVKERGTVLLSGFETLRAANETVGATSG